jgi:hypothetical protein
MDDFRTLILSAAVTPLAQQIASTLSPAGAGMWTTPLAPSTEGPATHYISTGYISSEFAHMVPCQAWVQDEGGAWVVAEVTPGSPEAVTQACNALGMAVTLAEVQAVFAGADVSAQEPFVAMGRMGLVMVSADLEPAA